MIGAVSFLNKFGPSLIDRLADALTLDLGVHTVIAP